MVMLNFVNHITLFDKKFYDGKLVTTSYLLTNNIKSNWYVTMMNVQSRKIWLYYYVFDWLWFGFDVKNYRFEYDANTLESCKIPYRASCLIIHRLEYNTSN